MRNPTSKDFSEFENITGRLIRTNSLFSLKQYVAVVVVIAVPIVVVVVTDISVATALAPVNVIRWTCTKSAN